MYGMYISICLVYSITTAPVLSLLWKMPLTLVWYTTMTDFTGLEAREAEFDDEMDGGSGGAKGSA